MEYFDDNVAYLENEDFDANGRLKINTNLPVVVMVQGNYCGYCSQAKPAFQAFAKRMKGKIFPATIQIDGNTGSEKQLGDRIREILKGKFQGVPVFVAFKNGNLYKEHEGDRTEEAFVQFANSL